MENYYSVYLNTDGELYCFRDQEVPKESFSAMNVLQPYYAITKDSKMVKTQDPNSLTELKVFLYQKNNGLRKIGTLHQDEAGFQMSYLLNEKNPFIKQLSHTENSNFITFKENNSELYIPYESICYFRTEYIQGILSSVSFSLKNTTEKIYLHIGNEDQHLNLVSQLERFKEWSDEN